MRGGPEIRGPGGEGLFWAPEGLLRATGKRREGRWQPTRQGPGGGVADGALRWTSAKRGACANLLAARNVTI